MGRVGRRLHGAADRLGDRHARVGRPVEHAWHNTVDVTVAFGGVFAVTAAAIYVPVFAMLSAL